MNCLCRNNLIAGSKLLFNCSYLPYGIFRMHRDEFRPSIDFLESVFFLLSSVDLVQQKVSRTIFLPSFSTAISLTTIYLTVCFKYFSISRQSLSSSKSASLPPSSSAENARFGWILMKPMKFRWPTPDATLLVCTVTV